MANVASVAWVVVANGPLALDESGVRDQDPETKPAVDCKSVVPHHLSEIKII